MLVIELCSQNAFPLILISHSVELCVYQYLKQMRVKCHYISYVSFFRMLHVEEVFHMREIPFASVMQYCIFNNLC